MKSSELLQNVLDGALDLRMAKIYGDDGNTLSEQRERYAGLIRRFIEQYGDMENVSLFSVPGRSELSGNHTDHNRGRVIAGSVDLDIIAVAVPCNDSVIRVKSQGFPEDVVNIADYLTPDETRFGRSDALIAGVCDGFRKRGFSTGGFYACTSSNVLKGSGLSSSAAFENMIGTILSHLYNSGKVDPVTIAEVSQYAENEFFGKPCGLMDQIACAVGGIVSIDFADTSAPKVEKLDFDLTEAGYNLCIVNTGGNHADLTADYAAVPAEMKAVAKKMGCDFLREVSEEDVISAIPDLRRTVGDRAVLRALHFFEENRRVDEQKNALLCRDLEGYFSAVLESGRSSFCYLQNVYSTQNVSEQGISLALCLCDRYISACGRPGAWRVHGGGFAGTVQAYVPRENAEDFRVLMEGIFGKGSCYMLRIRPVGAVRLY